MQVHDCVYTQDAPKTSTIDSVV